MDENIVKRVVGLQYELGEGLPKVILKGSGRLAQSILDERRKLGGPALVKDERLLQALYQLPIEGEIGEELFELVAILLVHVFAIDNRVEE